MALRENLLVYKRPINVYTTSVSIQQVESTQAHHDKSTKIAVLSLPKAILNANFTG